ncbi:ZIP family metal transporter [Aquabacterium sp. J223]|uniref:ZIP family metal transporter n=1 Tax=Aquabacterium sp. J223 TaxID=2898431 RepID=UPI0021AD9584|nr:ZIP family metal transporter [Aquabacterium sp. J223]UUX95671.1 ZIP family metal transporter [Aquabacterium sp. J223]
MVQAVLQWWRAEARLPGWGALRTAGALSLLLALAVLAVLATSGAGVRPGGWSQGLRDGLTGGLWCALATAAGAGAVLVVRRMAPRVEDALMGFGAGVMLAATAFSLLLPGLAAAGEQGLRPAAAGLLVSAGLLSGVLAMLLLDRAWPHRHFDGRGHDREGPGRPMGRVTLFVLAITLHNIPEGMAVGVAAGAAVPEARELAAGIALQDIPEGLVIALALVGAGLPRGRAALLGALSGVVEPAFAVLAALAVNVFSALLPWGLSLAAGAMLFAVSHEVIPESHRRGHETWATLGLAVGFCLMMVMDTSL